MDGRKSLLAHVDLKSKYKVGKYGVDVSGFERFIEPIPILEPCTDLIGIDEIGKMECFSTKFNHCIKAALDADKIVLATIARKGSGLIADLKNRRDIQLYGLTRYNRESLFLQILKVLN